MKIWICGIAGVLGSGLANHLSSKGYKVAGNDIVRREEAWRIESDVKYVWKSTWDLRGEDLEGYELIIDASIGFADRPFGDDSPLTTLISNTLPIARVLEVVRRMPDEIKPIVIYPSSFNACYGLQTVIKEDTPPIPSNIYGATKAIAEILCNTYRISYDVPVIITRVGSAYGTKGRGDELPHKLIIYGLKGKKFYLKSPEAKRVWTYQKDVFAFYDALLENIFEVFETNLPTLICAGNKGDRVVSNVELAKIIKKFIPELEWREGEYEPGEDLRKELQFDATKTRELLKWKPKWELEDGIKETIEWFKENIHRYKA